MAHELVRVATREENAAYHAQRNDLLWLARGRGGYDADHPDERNPDNHPLILKHDGRMIGTIRLDDFGNGTGAIRQVTIARDCQRCGHGRVMAALVEARARSIGLGIVFVNAAPDAVGFYERLGWVRFIWNDAERTAANSVQMCKRLPAAP